jgi:hypothetical protein
MLRPVSRPTSQVREVGHPRCVVIQRLKQGAIILAGEDEGYPPMTRKPIPNYERFDFNKFVDSVIDLGFSEMFQAFDGECARVEASMRGRGGPQARADGGGEYVARLKRMMFWFHHGALADYGVEAATCHRISVKLVEKRQLKPEALNVFNR